MTPPTSDSPALTNEIQSDFESMKESNDSSDLLDLIVRNPLGGPVVPGSPRQLTTPPVSAAYQFISPIPSPALGGVKQQQHNQHNLPDMKESRKVSHSPQLCTPPLPTTAAAEPHHHSPHHMLKNKLTQDIKGDSKEHRRSPHQDKSAHHHTSYQVGMG